MAVDTALKRGSAVNIGSPWRGILPLPDGTVGAADWPVVAFLYSGIQADEPVTGGGSGDGVTGRISIGLQLSIT